MNNKIGLYILSSIFLFEGIASLLGFKVFFKYLGGWRNVSLTYSILITITGLLFLYFAYKSKKQITHSICPKCEETFNYYELKDGMCPNCDIPTKDLDGYYDSKKDD